MNKKELYRLYKEFLEGTISDDDLKKLKQITQRADFENLWNDMTQEYLVNKDIAFLPVNKANKVFDSILLQLDKNKRPSHFRKKIGYVATVAAVLVSLFFVYKDFIVLPYGDQQLEDKIAITPGSAKGNLLLEDGTMIDLEHISSDTTIFLNGYQVSKDRNGELHYTITSNSNVPIYNTIMTPKGGEYKLNLSDGTVIWVNAASKLRYPLNFGTSAREIELEGEALFEVKKIQSGKDIIPFIVYSGNQKVQVLGTVFNVNTYNAVIKTTLLEGSIQISAGKEKPIKMHPNQQAMVHKTNDSLFINDVDPYYAMAWKNGVFAFDNAHIRDVMQGIARWYNVDVSYKREIDGLKFTGALSKYEQIQTVLDMIEMTESVKFKVEGRRIIVM